MNTYMGKKEWTSPQNQFLYTTLWQGRRFLYLGDDKIAEQLGAKGPPENWVKKKIAQRAQSTEQYRIKIDLQLVEVSKEQLMWATLCNTLGVTW